MQGLFLDSSKSSILSALNRAYKASYNAFLALSLSGQCAFIALIMLCTLALFAPLIAPYPQEAQDLEHILAPFSSAHLLGTDYLGRDIFSRILFGARLSLSATIVILVCILALGISVGGLCGFVGGRLDSVCMRVCDIFMSMPTIALSLFLVAVLGSGLENVMIAIVATHWAWYARIARSIVLDLKTKPFVLLSYTFGASAFQRFKRHIITPICSQCAILASMDLGHIMLHIAALSFLGLGVQPPSAEWGIMISEARDYMWDYPRLMILPGLALFIAVALCNMLGEALREKLSVPHRIIDVDSSAKFAKLDIKATKCLSLHNLSIANQGNLLLKSLSLDISRGECVALLGRSGAGKSLSALALQGFIASNLTKISGEIKLDSSPINPALYRGRAFCSIMQNPKTCFNALFSVHSHFRESLRALHLPYNKDAILQCLKDCELDSSILKSYPFELSGGQLQRVMIALSLVLKTPFIIADEPSSDLDKPTALQILATLQRLQKQQNLGILLITHDLDIVARFANKVCVIEQGAMLGSATIANNQVIVESSLDSSFKTYSTIKRLQALREGIKC